MSKAHFVSTKLNETVIIIIAFFFLYNYYLSYFYKLFTGPSTPLSPAIKTMLF